MSELAQPLRHVLSKTGYLKTDGRPAASTVSVCAGDEPRRGTLNPDVRWRNANLNVYFKYAENPTNEVVGAWQQEVWNEGSVPLLWVVEPRQTTLYNGFAVPQGASAPAKSRLDTFGHDGAAVTASTNATPLDLSELNVRAGRLSMETGNFWRNERRVNRKHAVDARLLRDMESLERSLRRGGLPANQAQGLIGRAIFAQYLVDRGVITEQHLLREYDTDGLHNVLANPQHAERLFRWLTDRFNGDMFPSSSLVPGARSLKDLATFLKGEMSGQGSLFPYRFELIPVELISAIYEQFVHSADADSAENLDVHYTPLAAVSLILDEVMQGISGDESVLDITCGSGVFLVEALRRLVEAKQARCGERTRPMVRQALDEQVFGVDKSAAAIQVAAFSLYLAALELDPDPNDAEGLEFAPLVGKTLHIADARKIDLRRKFDIIVGNPPWSYRGRAGTAARRYQGGNEAKSPRGVSFDFAKRAREFAGEDARLGMVLSATPFFAESATGRLAAQELVQSLSPLTLIDLSSQKWMFRKARMPAMGLVARYRPDQDQREMALVRVPWSMAGQNGHALDVSASDIQMLHLASWRRNPSLFKSSFVGRLHDHLLLEELFEGQRPLKDRLAAIGTALHLGWTRGSQGEDTAFLSGLPFLEGNLRRFSVQKNLPLFDEQGAERPRDRSIYKAPLLIVQENMRQSPRPVAAVADEDVVYTKSYFGIPLPAEHGWHLADLLAGILSSAFAAWYLYMSGPDLGLWKSRVKIGTAKTIPTPDLMPAAASESGRRLVDVVRNLRHKVHGDPSEDDYRELDDAVSELYGFGESERIVIRDGLLRARWQWKEGQLESVAPVNLDQLVEYATAFVSKFDPWFRAANQRRLHAEVYEAAASESLRVVRFLLESHPPPSDVRTITPNVPTSQVLAEACNRLNASSALDELARNGEIRFANGREIVIAKPSARRHWLAVDAFADARLVLEESFRSGAA